MAWAAVLRTNGDMSVTDYRREEGREGGRERGRKERRREGGREGEREERKWEGGREKEGNCNRETSRSNEKTMYLVELKC